MTTVSFPTIKGYNHVEGRGKDTFSFKSVKFGKRTVKNLTLHAEDREKAAKILVVYQRHIEKLNDAEWKAFKAKLKKGYHIHFEHVHSYEKKKKVDLGTKAVIKFWNAGERRFTTISQEISLDQSTLSTINQWASTFGNPPKKHKNGISIKEVKNLNGIQIKEVKNKRSKKAVPAPVIQNPPPPPGGSIWQRIWKQIFG